MGSEDDLAEVEMTLAEVKERFATGKPVDVLPRREGRVNISAHTTNFRFEDLKFGTSSTAVEVERSARRSL